MASDSSQIEAEIKQLKRQGNSWFAKEDYTSAIKYYTLGLQHDIYQSDTFQTNKQLIEYRQSLFLNRAKAYFQSKNINEALIDTQRCIKLHTHSKTAYKAHFARSEIYFNLHDYQNALRHCDIILNHSSSENIDISGLQQKANKMRQQIEQKMQKSSKHEKVIEHKANDDMNVELKKWKKKCSELTQILHRVNKEKVTLSKKIQILTQKNDEWKLENERLRQQILNVMQEEHKQEMEMEEVEKCQIKFQQWLFNVVKMGQYLPLFEQNEYNDIRMIEFLDDEILRNEIGIEKALHRKLFIKKVEQFRVRQMEFAVFLENVKGLKVYKQELEQHGILTLKDLQNDIPSKKELSEIMGDGEDGNVECLLDVIHRQHMNDNHLLLLQNEIEGQTTEMKY